jgi:hypothetical protein
MSHSHFLRFILLAKGNLLEPSLTYSPLQQRRDMSSNIIAQVYYFYLSLPHAGIKTTFTRV